MRSLSAVARERKESSLTLSLFIRSVVTVGVSKREGSDRGRGLTGRRQSYLLLHSARNLSHSVIVITRQREDEASLGGPNLDNIRAERIASGIIRNIVPFCRGPKWGLMGNYECKISCFINFDAVSAANKHSACHKSRMASFNFRIGASFMCGKISTRSIKGQGKRSRERGLGITTHTARTTCNFSN